MSRNEIFILVLAAGAVGALALGVAISAGGGGILALTAAGALAAGGLTWVWRTRQGRRSSRRARRPAKQGSAIPVARPRPPAASMRVAPSPPAVSPLDRLYALRPDEFEEFVRLLFEAGGLYHDVRRVGRSGDGGVDLTMVDSAGYFCVVQCKRYKGTVPAGQIRDLAGVLMLHGPREAYFVTTGRVSAGAQALIGAHPIHVWDGARLLHYAQGWLGEGLEETIERARQGHQARS